MHEETQVQSQNPNPVQAHFLESKHLITISQIEGVYTGLDNDTIIRSFHPATNRSFVAQISFRKIQHYSAEGEVIGVLDVQKCIEFVFMASPSIVMIVTGSMLQQDRDHEIIQWDLGNYQTTSIGFTRSFKKICFLDVFTESKLFCFGEKDTTKVGLLYFKYPLKQFKSAETHQKVFHNIKFRLNHKQMSRELKTVKMNNRSMVGWIGKELTPSQNEIEFYVYDLEKNDETWRTIKIHNTV